MDSEQKEGLTGIFLMLFIIVVGIAVSVYLIGSIEAEHARDHRMYNEQCQQMIEEFPSLEYFYKSINRDGHITVFEYEKFLESYYELKGDASEQRR